MNDGSSAGFWDRVAWFVITAVIMVVIVWGAASVWGSFWEWIQGVRG